ncbi:gliding motility-associated ABC transporter ATP-binding subunit GldA [Tenacibaculum piscium]|uniref:Gliding motility-associated ABC transporter ATP-binding subunit GldA n=3 Tax=Tenacibaculum piscium TaxID=1458515 RepID=A0A2H1YJ21_9FLAO|nr:gliding motility-associated ABC transporter ATP-binding subunit GldA [Tenacibaculum piscium]MBE7628717.1 gliding motility-associated ABC transporter ATP-binding subunit GldA [Tenacibaculum piscium]MBE7669858.1 gliding motility-associated ABC transporter ATP-binding subunit GldA [Tenacibaculum piscium]MBE7684547.1 gliding motility-associated ABC transporter ATP-binding subunit GldA [Tenacibaculum piscium]MBE7689167.1 gliding motility-associated ABC transporter ATP-binding subunit GldA [Tenaci
MSIQLTEISKFYGTQKAVNSISFEAKKGEIVGFLGPNGAGKSTTMKILTGFIPPSEGTVFVNGIDVLKNPIEAQKNIGYLPEHNPLYLEMYVREYLQFQAAIYKVSKNKIAEVIKKVGLTSEAHKKIGELSKGYRQRVGLAAAILHDPEVLILDEPTTGLDPNQLVEIRELIKELGKDKTVLFSTHIMQEVEAVCNRVIIINKGEIVIDKPIVELKTSKEQIIKVTFDYKLEEQFIQRLPNIVHYKNTVENNWILTFETSEDMRPVIFDFAQENGLKILGLNTENKNLESLFRELTN